MNNFNFLTFECFVKLIKNINLLQQNIKNQFANFLYLHKNIIRAVRNYSALITKLVNSPKNVIDLINNLHFSIINYKTIHRLSVDWP